MRKGITRSSMSIHRMRASTSQVLERSLRNGRKITIISFRQTIKLKICLGDRLSFASLPEHENLDLVFIKIQVWRFKKIILFRKSPLVFASVLLIINSGFVILSNFFYYHLFFWPPFRCFSFCSDYDSLCFLTKANFSLLPFTLIFLCFISLLLFTRCRSLSLYRLFLFIIKECLLLHWKHESHQPYCHYCCASPLRRQLRSSYAVRESSASLAVTGCTSPCKGYQTAKRSLDQFAK